jgi:REP element-mobilizing transposase RayT
MSRPLRVEHVGGWYHVTGRGNERRAIFRDDRDRAHFLELLEGMTGRFGVSLNCFALMDNHYHLLLRLEQAHLSRALQWLNLSYTAWFNRRHDRAGHLFQGRFKSILFDPSSAALELSRYVHLNPVRVDRLGLGKARRAATRAGGTSAPEAGQMQERLALLRSYRWSSYRAFIGTAPCPPWLNGEAILRINRGAKAQRREDYRRYVEAAAGEGLDAADVWAELKEGCILGSQRFIAQVREQLAGSAEEQKAAARLKRIRPPWEAMVACVEKVAGASWVALQCRHADRSRDMALYLGRRVGCMKLRALAQAAGMKQYGAAAMAIKRYEDTLRNDNAESRRLRKAIQMLNVKM